MDLIQERVKQYFKDCKNGCNNLITPEELLNMIKGKKKDFFILDIRKEEDFEKEHISGAVNIFWYEVGDFLDALPKDQKIIVVCYSGQSAGQIVAILRLLGYDACSLKGGMMHGWLKDSLPIESGCG